MQTIHLLRLFVINFVVIANLSSILAYNTLSVTIPAQEENIDDEFNYLVMGGQRASAVERVRAMVSIRSAKHTVAFGDNHICSGTIISIAVVITAAHCLVE